MKLWVCFFLIFVGLVILLVMILSDKPDPVLPTGNPGVMVERPSLVGGSNTVVIADSSMQTETVNVEEAGEVSAAVTIEADATGDPVHLFVDRPAPAWIPEADLIATNIRIRTLHPWQAPLVTVVQQRMPVL